MVSAKDADWCRYSLVTFYSECSVGFLIFPKTSKIVAEIFLFSKSFPRNHFNIEHAYYQMYVFYQESVQ